MTVLSESQLREIDGEGFWDGFVCGASVGALIWAATTPDPVSKLALSTLVTAAVGSCGKTFL